ncbi:hypothetical protein FB566_2151 [Stackebrandtia endophytica]|uniref:Endonuclease/exonuclease/phosphatase family protein n=1 Tax=Stackebrandtia endophytica TaxID=1496996 RepID=A0A543AVL0_9ACTN|nr:hypothetical protein [Stackebrandtia endophytica]TQL76618.1 hypothetical protein FB566_2151 [Stackebrandtia endophytica]
MRTHGIRRWLLGVTAALALIVSGGHAIAAAETATPASQPSPTNPNQAYGPGIITVKQTNMCMWGSLETPFCFANSVEPGTAGWEAAERKTAERKRASLVVQYQRHLPDVLTVTEGCLGDLEIVAETIGYQLRYQETGGGTDGKARECTVDRGIGVNAILAKKFTGDGPSGYFQEQGYRSYLCARVSVNEQWNSFQVCTTHLSLSSQGDRQQIECAFLRDSILDKLSGDVILAGDLNMKGRGQHCAPDDFNGLKNTERKAEDNTALSGLQHIYYSSTKIWRQSCAWSYAVSDTDHRSFLLELGRSRPDDNGGPCWRGIAS